MMIHKKGSIHCSCADALYPPQATQETNVTSHAFQPISNLNFFWMFLRATENAVAHGRVVGPHWLNQTALMQSFFNTLRGWFMYAGLWKYT